MVKKIFFILIIFGGYLFYCPEIVLAQDGGVQVRANVLERKFTDTMNDFNFDGIDYTKPSFKAILGASTEVPSKTIEKPSSGNSRQFNWKNLLFLSTVYDTYYLVRLIS